MPEYRRATTEGGTFFFTIVTYERRPILCLEKSRAIMRDVIRSVAKRHPFAVNAWVVLPDHMHCLWTLPGGDKNFSVRWALIEREFTRGLRTTLAEEAASETEVAPNLSRERHREGTAWQRRFWEHQIRDEKDYAAHMDYIHFNPVKHGLVKSPKDWPYSTFHQHVASGVYNHDWGSSGDLRLPPGVGRE